MYRDAWLVCELICSSNCLRLGNEQNERSVTHSCGGTRSVLFPSSVSRFIPLTFQIEYLVCSFDDESKTVKLSLRQADILEALAADEKLKQKGGGVPDIHDCGNG